MIAVVLQPSYIPWRGYFHQILRADTFVFYDDVQYDKHGWRNRNQIKTSQGKKWLTIPVHSGGATQGILINQVRIDWSKPWAKNHMKTLATAYGKAPYFGRYRPLLESFYERRDALIADFTIHTTIRLARELGIRTTRFVRSSELGNISGRKTERLIRILQHVGAVQYLSGPSARDYLDPAEFVKAGIALEYMDYEYPEYPQLHPPFDPNVSVLDLLFMTGPEALRYFAGGTGGPRGP